MNRISRLLTLVLSLVFIGSLSGCMVREFAQQGTETTVILIRHAERTTVTKELTEEGHQRARALVDAVGDMNIVAIYSPNLRRNLDTVRPLAEHKGIEITALDKPTVQQVVKTLLDKHPGETVLWVGNTTNLDGIYSLLGGSGDPPDNYGDLFILTVYDAGDTKVIKRTFGS